MKRLYFEGEFLGEVPDGMTLDTDQAISDTIDYLGLDLFSFKRPNFHFEESDSFTLYRVDVNIADEVTGRWGKQAYLGLLTKQMIKNMSAKWSRKGWAFLLTVNGETLDEEGFRKFMSGNEAAATLGRLGGKAKSEKKAAAVRENGKKGGRPVKIYDSGEMSVGGNRGQVIIYKTPKGIAVEINSLYSDQADKIEYYTKYPEIPTDWEKEINAYGTTEAQLFLEDLNAYIPYRTVLKK